MSSKEEVGDCLVEAVRLVNRWSVPLLSTALMQAASVELDDDRLINERVFRWSASRCAEVIGRHPHGVLATIVHWDANGRDKEEMLNILRRAFETHTQGEGE